MAKGQKKQKQTPEVISKLEQAFAIGSSTREACFFAGISESTYYQWCKDNPSLMERMKLLKQKPVLKSRQVVMTALNNNDVATARWYLERKCKDEFSQRSEVSTVEPVTEIKTEYVD